MYYDAQMSRIMYHYEKWLFIWRIVRMPGKLLTIAEVAKQLDIPESTARYYRDKFENYIPYVGKGRQRRYKPETVEVLRVIAEGFSRNLTAMEIEEALNRMFAVSMEVQEKTASATAVAQQQLEMEQTILLPMILESLNQMQQSMVQMSLAIQKMNDQQKVITDQQEEIAELRKVVESLKLSEFERLREAAEREKRLIERMDEIERAQTKKKRWWPF